ncbi:hypothetical protein WR25_02333 isoform B [Diploscapter pachys]|nr:hypothetical protein WR25_02333 isoform B [Diploscapter pachys]
MVFARNISSNVYLATLALLDMLICLTYILLFGVDAAIVYLRDATLFQLYFRYILQTLFLAKVVQFAIPYMLIVITFERYLWTAREKTRQMFAAVFSDTGRFLTVLFLAAFSLAMRFPVILATELSNPMSNRAFNEFTLQKNGNMPENCVLLEVATEVIKESLVHRSSRSKRSQLRNAIYTMLAIVTSYLMCNSIHMFTTLLEKFDSNILYSAEDPNQSSNFYIALSDTVSILYMVTSAIRIFIYCKCNPKLRNEIRQFITRSGKMHEVPVIE